MKFQRFEDIEAWQKARMLTQKIYTVSKHAGFNRDFGLRDQIRKASVSIMANIAEGFERGGTREFVQFLSVAKASAGEVRSHLCVALDQSYINQDEFEELTNGAIEIGRMISSLMNYLSNIKFKGNKYEARVKS